MKPLRWMQESYLQVLVVEPDESLLELILTRQDPITHRLRVFACFVKPMPMASLVDSIRAAAFEAGRSNR
jgi:hypothetical protein